MIGNTPSHKAAASRLRLPLCRRRPRSNAGPGFPAPHLGPARKRGCRPADANHAPVRRLRWGKPSLRPGRRGGLPGRGQRRWTRSSDVSIEDTITLCPWWPSARRPRTVRAARSRVGTTTRTRPAPSPSSARIDPSVLPRTCHRHIQRTRARPARMPHTSRSEGVRAAGGGGRAGPVPGLVSVFGRALYAAGRQRTAGFTRSG